MRINTKPIDLSTGCYYGQLPMKDHSVTWVCECGRVKEIKILK